jgi:hypothetical protein
MGVVEPNFSSTLSPHFTNPYIIPKTPLTLKKHFIFHTTIIILDKN